MEYSYHAEKDDELDLEEGDVVLVFNKPENGWWRGMIGEREGLFLSELLQGCMFVSVLQSFFIILEAGALSMWIFLWQILQK